MKVTETYNQACSHCGGLGYVNYYLADGKTGSQYTNVCPVCNGSKTVIVTREYEIPDPTMPQIVSQWPAPDNRDAIIEKQRDLIDYLFIFVKKGSVAEKVALKKQSDLSGLEAPPEGKQ